jgi:hypothetical protein
MTDVYASPPPPPPPPTPPSSVAFDFIRPFAFFFEDPRWLPKVLIGGLFVLASFVLIGVFFLFGYVAKLIRNVIAGMRHPLPEWDELGEFFGEGLMLFVITLIYSAPIVLLAIVIAVPAALMSAAAQNDNMRDLTSGVFGCAWCIVAPLSLALWFFVPGALLMAIVDRRFGAAFEFGRIWSFIKANIGNYLLAMVVYLVSRFAAGFGVILLCIGVVFTEFWAMTVAGYAFAEVYRLSQRR